MQQVQAGKLNLDTDVNTYLDFKIPPQRRQADHAAQPDDPHAGFRRDRQISDRVSASKPEPLGKVLSRGVPERIYAPGTMPAYSNYGASLAGYIVERVSGEPFDEYVQQHIFAPLGMAHSTLRPAAAGQPAALLSKAYKPGTDEPAAL